MQLIKYVPYNSIKILKDYLLKYKIKVKVVKKRKSKHGDFRISKDGSFLITINESENKFRFLITFIHELAHFVAFKENGFKIKPHGIEWKVSFNYLMRPLLNQNIFPIDLLQKLKYYLKNPKASTDSDFSLSIALKKNDLVKDKVFIYELIDNSFFILDNGRVFKKIKKIIKRFECIEQSSGKTFLFSPHAQVKVLNKI